MSKRSEQINELAAALSKAQGEMKGAAKDSENPFFHSSYADLASVWDACRIPLTKNGLAVVQVTHLCEVRYNGEGDAVAFTNELFLDTVLLHTSGQYMTGTLPIRPVKDDPQGMGSAITYARRYGLMAIVGISPEDDDANTASGRPFDTKAKDLTHTATKETHKDDKLKNEDYIMPIGRNKGKKLSGIPKADLKSTVTWCQTNNKFADLAEAITKYLDDTGLDFDQRPESEVKEAAKSQPGASVEEIEPPQKPAGPQEVVDAKTGEILNPLAVNSHKLRSVQEQQIKFAKSKTSIESIKSRITKATEAGELLPTDAEHLTLLVNGKSHTIK